MKGRRLVAKKEKLIQENTIQVPGFPVSPLLQIGSVVYSCISSLPSKRAELNGTSNATRCQ